MSTPTPMPRTCGEISCDECNDRYAALAAECDQLRAEAERLKTCGIAELAAVNSSVLDYCKHWEARAERAEAEVERLNALGSWAHTCTHHNDQQRAACPVCLVTTLTAERDQLRADRTYNHECINRLAVATGTLGEKSEKVVDVVLSTIDQLRAENVTLRGAQKACEACDEPTAFEVRQLRARAELAEVELIAEQGVRTWASAQLATERARLDSGQILLTVAGERVWHSGVDLRAAIDAAMQEATK